MDSHSTGIESADVVRDKIRKLFEDAQTQIKHQALLDKCKQLYRKYSDNGFLEEFKSALKYCLVFPDKSAVDNILQFVAKFTIFLYVLQGNQDDEGNSHTVSETCTFPTEIMNFTFQNHRASSVDVRLRCLQLLNKILSGLPENSTISDVIWVQLREIVLVRIQDKSHFVRVEAVLTGRKLQDLENPNCEIIKAFVFHLNDPNPAVRRAVVSSIAFNKLTIAHVLLRTRDVNDNVRRNTYIVFSKVRVLNLSIKYRLAILERGLQDRSAMVRNCVQSILLVNWLDSLNRNVIKFLEGLDVINCPDTTLMIAENILKVVPADEIVNMLPIDEETRTIPLDKLTPEIALLWRAVAQFFWNEKDDEALDQILPNITTFCNFVRAFYPPEQAVDPNLSKDQKWEEIKKKEILKHVLELVKVFDFCDEIGRSNVKKLISDLLISQRVDDNIVHVLIELLSLVTPSSDAFLREVTEIISEVREPLVVETVELPLHKKLDIEVNISNLKVTLNELREREYNAATTKDYATAQEIQSEIEKVEAQLKNLTVQTCVSQEVREERNDPVTMCKCLTMLRQMIRCSKVRTLTPTLRSIKDNFLNLCLTSQDLLTQSLALEVLGQCCILDLDMAKEHVFRFILTLSQNVDGEITCLALKSIFDIFLYYGMKPFEELHTFKGREEEEEAGQDEGGNGKESSIDEDIIVKKESKDDSCIESKFIPILIEMLNCKTNDTVKSIAFEGFCKLLAAGVVYSPSLLEKIIIVGFSPIIDNDAEDFIRQVFMVFFSVFSSTTPRSQEMIEAAFIPTLTRLFNAPLGSPEADINPRDVASFLVDYTKPDINKHAYATLHVHNNLALSICHKILEEAEQFEDVEVFSVYLKALLQLKLSLYEDPIAAQINVLMNRMKKELRFDRTLTRLMNEFKKKVEDSSRNAVTSVENTLATTADPTSSETASRVEPQSAVKSILRSSKKTEQESETDSSEDSDSVDSVVSVVETKRYVPESPEVSDSA